MQGLNRTQKVGHFSLSWAFLRELLLKFSAKIDSTVRRRANKLCPQAMG